MRIMSIGRFLGEVLGFIPLNLALSSVPCAFPSQHVSVTILYWLCGYSVCLQEGRGGSVSVEVCFAVNGTEQYCTP